MRQLSPILIVLIAALATNLPAQRIEWAGTDTAGTAVNVAGDRPSVVAFVRAGQEQSTQALEQIKKSVGNAAMQVIVVLSGPAAAEQARQTSTTLPSGWHAVADVEFQTSGKMNVHVWPTTLVLKADGTQLAHLAGLPPSFEIDLPAYLDLALGKIDQAALEKRLASKEVVADSAAQAAIRHRMVAQQFLDRGEIDAAMGEITQGLSFAPKDATLQLMAARAALLQNKPQEALDQLGRIDPAAMPAAKVNVVRARAMIGLDQWAQAKALLPDVIKLNPDPAEGHYLLGLCHQHDREFDLAAEQFRLAYEKTPGHAPAGR